MINIPFSSEFYIVFPAPNADELISTIDEVCNTKQIDNDFFNWGRHCKVDRIPLKWQKVCCTTPQHTLRGHQC